MKFEQLLVHINTCCPRTDVFSVLSPNTVTILIQKSHLMQRISVW